MIAVDESDATRNNDLFPSGVGTKRQPMGPGFTAILQVRRIGLVINPLFLNDSLCGLEDLGLGRQRK